MRELARIKSKAEQITKVHYHENCGLIVGCFRGYIENFDPVNFLSLGKWHNNINANPVPRESSVPPCSDPVLSSDRTTIPSPKSFLAKKQKPTKCEAFVDCFDYSEELDLIAFGDINGKCGFVDSRTLQFRGLF